METLTTTAPSFLSKREGTILGLIAEGLSSKSIAKTLFISENTVETHRRNMLRKAGVNNTAALLKIAIKSGMV